MSVYSVFIAIASAIAGMILYVALDIQVEDGKTDGALVTFFLRRPLFVELMIQITAVGGFCAIPFIMFLAAYTTEPVIAIDALLLSVIIFPYFAFGFRKRLRHLRDCLTGDSDISSNVALDVLEPVLNARLTLSAWILSIFVLIVAVLLPNTEQFSIISQVMLHYGLGGTLFIFSPAIFSVRTLNQQRLKSHDNV
ncbi:MAG: hypothetical protein RTU30_11420 [Candidatus Thorarchaeota archaeon]